MDIQTLLVLLNAGRKYGQIRCSDIDFNNTEMHICAYLKLRSPSSQDDIARAYSMDKTTVAKSISKLQLRGIVTKEVNSENRRENKISLTEEGNDVVKKIIKVQNDWIKEITKEIPEEEIRIFDSVAARMLEKSRELLK